MEVVLREEDRGNTVLCPGDVVLALTTQENEPALQS